MAHLEIHSFSLGGECGKNQVRGPGMPLHLIAGAAHLALVYRVISKPFTRRTSSTIMLPWPMVHLASTAPVWTVVFITILALTFIVWTPDPISSSANVKE